MTRFSEGAVPAVADADVLFGATTRGLLVFLDYEGVIRLHWSDLILAELSRALVDAGRKKTMREALAHERLLRNALPHALVDTQDVQARFQLAERTVRQVKDMHVAACACHLAAEQPGRGAVVLASRNAKDFIRTRLAALGVVLQDPDDFLLAQFKRDASGFADAFRAFREDLRSRPDPAALLDKLEADGQRRTAAALRNAEREGTVSL